MIQELFLYDKEKGLFKEILKQSTVMKGSYHVSPNRGNDLNANNLETYMKDPATGLTDEKNYPLCMCVTPRSRIIKINNSRWEDFTFNLFFITTTNNTGTNQIRSQDKDTNSSAHHIWYTWQDMKTCADQFLEALKITLKRTVQLDGNPQQLRSLINFDSEAVFNRLSKFNNDDLTGVSVAFNIKMLSLYCEELTDYPGIDDIIIPDLIIHESHTDG